MNWILRSSFLRRQYDEGGTRQKKLSLRLRSNWLRRRNFSFFTPPSFNQEKGIPGTIESGGLPDLVPWPVQSELVATKHGNRTLARSARLAHIYPHCCEYSAPGTYVHGRKLLRDLLILPDSVFRTHRAPQRKGRSGLDNTWVIVAQIQELSVYDLAQLRQHAVDTLYTNKW